RFFLKYPKYRLAKSTHHKLIINGVIETIQRESVRDASMPQVPIAPSYILRRVDIYGGKSKRLTSFCIKIDFFPSIGIVHL
ncbi:unnamed protein product, partial [Brassica rapa subsp. trilocularis]